MRTDTPTETINDLPKVGRVRKQFVATSQFTTLQLRHDYQKHLTVKSCSDFFVLAFLQLHVLKILFKFVVT